MTFRGFLCIRLSNNHLEPFPCPACKSYFLNSCSWLLGQTGAVWQARSFSLRQHSLMSDKGSCFFVHEFPSISGEVLNTGFFLSSNFGAVRLICPLVT